MMEKYKKFIYGILSFLISFILLIYMFELGGMFDRELIIKGDIFAQIFPLLKYLKGIFNGSNSLFYSFYKNLGGTMYGTFFYYLASPFNLILKFVKDENIPLFFVWSSIIKMSLCSVSMYIYMVCKNKTSNFLIVLFSCLYALMGYNLNFFSNMMWLDVVMIAPIVLLGLDRMINGKSPMLYILSLFISIVCNYYISYMLCIFCVMYFIYEILLKDLTKQEKNYIIKRFIIYSFLTGLMCAFFLIPCFFESRNYFRNLDIKSIFTFDFNVFNVFAKTYIGSANFKDLLNYSSINLYCGVFVFLLVYLYFFNKNISVRKKKFTLFMILFMILPCFLFPLNYVWHLFSKPKLFSYRYSFLLCFFLINIAYESYDNLDIKKNVVIPFFLSYFLISIFILITGYYDFINYFNIIITLVFLIGYFFALKLKKIFIIYIMIFIEMILSVSFVFNYNNLLSKRKLIDYDYINIVNKYKDNRMDFVDVLTYNDSILMEYYGVNNFLSTNNNRVMRFLIQVGDKQSYFNQNMYNRMYNPYILDSLLGLKNVIMPDKMPGYKVVDEVSIHDSTQYVYENPNYSGVGYMIKHSCNGLDFDFYYDQTVFNCLFDKDYKFYKEYKISGSDGYYSTKINDFSMFYLNYPNFSESGIIFDDDVIFYTNNYMYLYNSKENYKFEFSVDDSVDMDKFKIYYFDFEKYKTVYNTTVNEVLDYKIVGSKLYGNINTNGGILMLTIPYENGFDIKVDGKKTEYIEVLDTFVGIKLDKGEHEIVVEYNQPYLKHGIVVSFVSFVLIVICLKKCV